MAETGSRTAGASWPFVLICLSLLAVVTVNSQSTFGPFFEIHMSLPCAYKCACPLSTRGDIFVLRGSASELADTMEVIAAYLKGNYNFDRSCAEVARAINLTVSPICGIACPVDPTTSTPAPEPSSEGRGASSLRIDTTSDASLAPSSTSNALVAITPSADAVMNRSSSEDGEIVLSSSADISMIPSLTSDTLQFVSLTTSSNDPILSVSPISVESFSKSLSPSPSLSTIDVSPSPTPTVSQVVSTPSFTSTAISTMQLSPTPFTVGTGFLEGVNRSLTGPTVNISSVNEIFSALLSEVLAAEIIERGEAQAIIGNVADVADRLVALNNQDVDRVATAALGSSFIQLVDAVALSLLLLPGESITFDLGNITVITTEVDTVGMVGRPHEGVENIFGDSFISLPREVFTVNADNAYYGSVRVAAVHYRQFSSLLPHSESSLMVVDPIISSTLNNRAVRDLSNGVSIQVTHKPINRKPTCVFWNFTISNWDPSGCELLEFNSTSSLCRCNHLTHFAILLDVSNTQLPSIHLLVLEILSYIGGGISVVFLTLTICIFLALRSLWSLRTYIHIHLCSNLLISQVILLLGSGTERPFVQTEMGVNGTTIPTIGCTAVAVILQYFYTVTFMWMLMEGIILYIKLVKVFGTEDRKHYVIFTVVSYVLPLVYLILVVPLGLARPGHNTQGTWSYGATSACFLTASDYFILAFAIPVIVIILINCVFLVMVLVIISKKLRQSAEMSNLKKIRTWLRSTTSLVIIMGIAWLIGLFTFHEVVYYIATLFYGLQGVFIFLLFVVFAKQVRKDIKTHYQKFQASRSSSFAANASDRKSPTLFSILNFLRRSGANQHSGEQQPNSKSSTGNALGPLDKDGGKTNTGIELGTFEGKAALKGNSSVLEANNSMAELVKGTSSVAGDGTIKLEHSVSSPLGGQDLDAEVLSHVSVGTDECVMVFTDENLTDPPNASGV